MKNIATIEDVEIEIRRAILILKTLPKEGPRKPFACWPEFLNVIEEDEKYNTIYIKPLPDEIDDMNTVFEIWMKVLDFDERRLILNRISGWGWKKLSYQLKISRNTLYRYYKKGLKKILEYVLEMQRIQENTAAERNNFLETEFWTDEA